MADSLISNELETVAEHLVVQSYQTNYYISWYFFNSNSNAEFLDSLVLPYLIFFTWWNGQFLNALFAPIWFFVLPGIAFIYAIDYWVMSGTLISLSSYVRVLRDF